MSRRVFCLSAVTAVVCLVAACGSREGEPEKAFAKVEERYRQVLQNPAAAETKEFEAAVAGLRCFIGAHPGWKGSAGIQYAVGRMYADRNHVGKAIEELSRVYMNYPERGALCAQARFLIGVLHEKQGNWNSALKEFNEITERYPTSAQGFNAPLYVADHYRRNHMPEEFGRACENAVKKYLDVIAFDPGDTAPALTALDCIVSVYGRSGKWKEGLKVIETLAGKYPDRGVGEAALFKAAMMYRSQLNDPEKALAVLRSFTARYERSEQYRDAVFGIGALLASAGKLDEARSALEGLKEKYRNDRATCAKAQLAIARGYERSGDQATALREYREVLSRYPGTVESLEACLLIARNKQAGVLREEALDFLSTEGPELLEAIKDKRDIIAVSDLVSTGLFLRGRWQEGIDTLKALLRKCPPDRDLAPVLFKVGGVYRRQLNDAAKARYYYARLIREHPGHALARSAKEMLAQMEQKR